jgi:hypothetical protein
MTELPPDRDDPVVGTPKKEKKKKNKEESKRKRNDDPPAQEEALEDEAKHLDPKDARRVLRQKEREARKKVKEELLTNVPKLDEDGIKYTKIQIKRMMKRVKRGLPPVPTEAEENERRRNEAQLRREEEDELAGLTPNKFDNDEQEEQQEIPGGEENKNEEDKKDDFGSEEKDAAEPVVQQKQTNPKKAKRSKVVPHDYTCMACKNRHKPVHWIYDCPDKLTVRGTNKTAKKLRGLHENDPKKLFVSGLPFEVKPADVSIIFQACGRVVSCKLLWFADTRRCNGQAYVTFDTDKGAEEALKLSGTTIDNASSDNSKKKGKKSAEGAKRKELKLKVSRAVNRNVSKKS